MTLFKRPQDVLTLLEKCPLLTMPMAANQQTKCFWLWKRRGLSGTEEVDSTITSLAYNLALASVTRFSEIFPLSQNFKRLWLFFEGLFCIGQNFEPHWANF